MSNAALAQTLRTLLTQYGMTNNQINDAIDRQITEEYIDRTYPNVVVAIGPPNNQNFTNDFNLAITQIGGLLNNNRWNVTGLNLTLPLANVVVIEEFSTISRLGPTPQFDAGKALTNILRIIKTAERVALSEITNLPKPLTHEMLTSELENILVSDAQSAFQDSDGLISFVNLSSSFVTDNKEFETGRAVCDKVSNFFATLRIKVFGYLKQNPSKILPGDRLPTTQWDSAVTHYMQNMLTQAGGLTNYKVTTETFSQTQIVADFSTAFLKLIFDAATVPEAVITDVTKFIQGVGSSLRVSWDDRSRNYQTALLGQCHEAVPIDTTGSTTVYFPKIKYYYISVDSSQTAFTSPCTSTKMITFDFHYEYYVTGLKASVLDETTTDYKNFVKFLDNAQNISYKEAENNLDAILGNTTSTTDAPGMISTDEHGLNIYGVDLLAYPKTATQPPKLIETILNNRIKEG